MSQKDSERAVDPAAHTHTTLTPTDVSSSVAAITATMKPDKETKPPVASKRSQANLRQKNYPNNRIPSRDNRLESN